MATVIFWEKPGCKGNDKQKKILLASGHQLEVRDLLTENWSSDELAKFFGDRPVQEWFNITNPKIKSGKINPQNINAEDALQMMVSEPLLIGRPLMKTGQERMAGFDVQQVHNWIGLKLDSIGERDPKNCPCVSTAE